MTNALAALGVLAVVSSAQMNSWTNGVCLVGLAAALSVPERFQQKPWLAHLATGGPLALFCIEGAKLFAGQSALDVAIEFAALLQIIRLATRRGAAHDQQIILLALLHFVVGTVLGGGLAFGLCFLGFLLVAPGALVLSHLRREVEGNYRQGARDRTGLPVDVPRILRSRRVVGKGFLLSTGLLSVPIFIFTAVLFLIFPRVGLSLLLINHNRSGRMVGFSDRVDLGDVGVLRSDPSIALRFEVPNLPEPPPPRLTLRLRGTAFDSYDGKAWARTQTERHAEGSLAGTYAISRLPRASDRLVRFDLEPIEPPVLFFPSQSVAFQLRTRAERTLGEPTVISRGPEGEYRYTGSDTRGVRYEVYVTSDDELQTSQLSEADRKRYLYLPHEFSPRIATLADEWTRDEPHIRDKARLVEERLKKQYTYGTNSPSGGTSEPVAHFLFDSKKGHCEFFSTSMALMLRSLHIPTRNVTGFVGGTYNRFGKYYAVREGDAHSWVEAYIDDGARSGWQTFDPTPNSGAQPLHATTGAWVYARDLVEALSQRWNAHIVGYDLRQQIHILDALSRRYERIRTQVGVTQGPSETLTRPSAIGLAAIFLATGGYLYWKYKARKSHNTDAKTPAAAVRDLQGIAALYRALEVAMQAHGLTRRANEPPLRFCEQLQKAGHPLAEEIASLTDIYLQARFGGTELPEPSRRQFNDRVQQLRTKRPEPSLHAKP